MILEMITALLQVLFQLDQLPCNLTRKRNVANPVNSRIVTFMPELLLQEHVLPSQVDFTAAVTHILHVCNTELPCQAHTILCQWWLLRRLHP